MSCPGASLLNISISSVEQAMEATTSMRERKLLFLYCDMTTDGGGWTMVLMVKDNDNTTFRYDSSYWTSTTFTRETVTDPTIDENVQNQAYHSCFRNRLICPRLGTRIQSPKVLHIHSSQVATLMLTYTDFKLILRPTATGTTNQTVMLRTPTQRKRNQFDMESQ